MVSRHLGWVLPLLVLGFVGVQTCAAQSAAEYAGAVSSASKTTAAGSKKIVFPADAEKKKEKFLHIGIQGKGNPVEANRRRLEEQAGDTPAKLLLRSEPSGAQVQVDGKLVGQTPLLLVVAPGSYEVRMRGARMEHGAKQVSLLPGETQRVALQLTRRYPAQIRLQ